jgi:hypothetical protein
MSPNRSDTSYNLYLIVIFISEGRINANETRVNVQLFLVPSYEYANKESGGGKNGELKWREIKNENVLLLVSLEIKCKYLFA